MLQNKTKTTKAWTLLKSREMALYINSSWLGTISAWGYIRKIWICYAYMCHRLNESCSSRRIY